MFRTKSSCWLLGVTQWKASDALQPQRDASIFYTANAAAKEYGSSGAFFLTITNLRPRYLFWRSAVLSQSPTEVEAKSKIYQPNIGLSPDCLLFFIDL
ncbi:MAG: hypothetical protein SOY88_05470 [Massilioclostridium sp.]|nr:hypothetical protein [Massilioclostridium sp.]